MKKSNSTTCIAVVYFCTKWTIVDNDQNKIQRQCVLIEQ